VRFLRSLVPRPGLTLVAVAAVIVLGLVLGVHRIQRKPPAAAPPSTNPSAEPTSDPDTVSFTGTGDVRFGQTAAELTSRHGLHTVPSACMPRFADLTQVRPILVDGKLAVLTLEPPAHTPEGIAVGASIAAVRRSYPGATELSSPQPYAYSGVLATNGEMGYLFLYTGDTVQRELVGYSRYLRQLFAAGFPTC